MLRLRRMLPFFEALYCLGISPSPPLMTSPASVIAHYRPNENDGEIHRLAFNKLKLPEDGHRTDGNTYVWYLTDFIGSFVAPVLL